jgi:WD40 repeat protein
MLTRLAGPLAFAVLFGLIGADLTLFAQGDKKKEGEKKEEAKKKEGEKKDEAKKKEGEKKQEAKKEEAKKEEAKKEEPKKQPKATIPPQQTLKGHKDWILGLAYNKDGTRLASASRDKTVKIWDPAGGKELLTIKDHPREVHAVAFSPDGKWLASTTGQWLKKEKKFQGEVRLWDAASGKPAGTLTGHEELVVAVAFHPENKQLASAAEDKLIILWDPDKKSQLHVLKGHTATVRALAYSPDGKRLASGGGDTVVKLWDTESGKELATLKGPTRDVSSLAFTPDGKRLAAGSLDGTVKVWDLADNNKEVLNLKGFSGILAVAVNRDGSRLAAAGWDQAVALFDPAGQEVFSFPAEPRTVTSMVFSPDGRYLATGGLDNLVKIWDTEKMK